MSERTVGMSDGVTYLVWEVTAGWLDSEVSRVKDRGEHGAAQACVRLIVLIRKEPGKVILFHMLTS